MKYEVLPTNTKEDKMIKKLERNKEKSRIRNDTLIYTKETKSFFRIFSFLYHSHSYFLHYYNKSAAGDIFV